jgi:ribosomal protein L20A (L18A)
MASVIDDTSVLVFKAITTFINDLYSEFGSRHKSISLYHRLLEKTGLMHTGPVIKHIDCFRTFFVKNKEAMETQNFEKFVDSKITYSERVYVDMATIFRHSDKECASIIWKHLLTIWGVIDPSRCGRGTYSGARAVRAVGPRPGIH